MPEETINFLHLEPRIGFTFWLIPINSNTYVTLDFSGDTFHITAHVNSFRPSMPSVHKSNLILRCTILFDQQELKHWKGQVKVVDCICHAENNLLFWDYSKKKDQSQHAY